MFERVLPLIASGQKDLEVRTSQRFFGDVVVGDIIVFSNSVRRKVVGVRKYENFDSMLEVEDPARIMPGYTSQQVLEWLRQQFTPCYEALGVVVFELKAVI